MIENRFIEDIARETKADPAHVKAAIVLFNGGATIPFVARYRKDVVGNLRESTLEQICDRNFQTRSFLDQRKSIIQTLEQKGVLTDSLRERMEACSDPLSLEDLYLPFKTRHRTTVIQAQDHGLTPLADLIWQQPDDITDLSAKAEEFANPEKDVPSAEKALEGARQILAERVALDTDVRGLVRNHLLTQGKITAASTKNAEGKKTKYQAYYNFSEPIATIPSHRVLAIRRGVKDGFLRMEVEVNDEQVLDEILGRILKRPETPFEEPLRLAVTDAYNRLLRPHIQDEVMALVRKRADTEAVEVFRKNTENLLLSAPAGAISVLAIALLPDAVPTYAVVNGDGTVQANGTLQDTDPDEKLQETLSNTLSEQTYQAIVISDTPLGRKMGRIVRDHLQKNEQRDRFCMFMHDTAAKVYALSKFAESELPALSGPARAAVSLGRRLQDPLKELVKIDPRSIGVGQYQHDANQKQLREGLQRTVESCVSRVGVDVNAASVELLRYVSGVQHGTAQNLVHRRTEQGPFQNRNQLSEVDGIGPRVFEHCAGFVRVTGGDNPLDATRIHPEAYSIVEKIAADANVSVAELAENADVLENVDPAQYATETVGPLALRDIRNELRRPWRDPRPKFRVPRFVEGVGSTADLTPDMMLEGVVTNITDFGVFVDVGIDHDGLVHLSELANRYVRDPHDVVRIGDVVKVKVMKVETEPSRISLSMKAAQPARDRKRRKQKTKPAPANEDQAAKRPEPKKDVRQKDGDRRSERPRKGKKDSKRKPKGGQKPKQPAANREENKEPLNTLLADQLAALKDELSK